jgi:hypothetical protein
MNLAIMDFNCSLEERQNKSFEAEKIKGIERAYKQSLTFIIVCVIVNLDLDLLFDALSKWHLCMFSYDKKHILNQQMSLSMP